VALLLLILAKRSDTFKSLPLSTK